MLHCGSVDIAAVERFARQYHSVGAAAFQRIEVRALLGLRLTRELIAARRTADRTGDRVQLPDAAHDFPRRRELGTGRHKEVVLEGEGAEPLRVIVKLRFGGLVLGRVLQFQHARPEFRHAQHRLLVDIGVPGVLNAPQGEPTEVGAQRRTRPGGDATTLTAWDHVLGRQPVCGLAATQRYLDPAIVSRIAHMHAQRTAFRFEVHGRQGATLCDIQPRLPALGRRCQSHSPKNAQDPPIKNKWRLFHFA